MTPDAIMEWAKVAAVVGGVCVGVFAVYSPAWVWLRKQIFGWGSVVLCAFGTILIVASIFRNVTFVVDVPKFEFKLAELQSDIAATKDAVAKATQEVDKLASEVATTDSTKTTSFARLEGLLNDMSRRTNALETNLQRVANQLSSQSSTIQQVSDKVDKQTTNWTEFGSGGIYCFRDKNTNKTTCERIPAPDLKN
jgi:methyl-accepting chemotaxis protein